LGTFYLAMSTLAYYDCFQFSDHFASTGSDQNVPNTVQLIEPALQVASVRQNHGTLTPHSYGRASVKRK